MEIIAPEDLPLSTVHLPLLEQQISARLPHEPDFLGLRHFPVDCRLFDVGANIGNSALSAHFVQPAWSITSFEPNPSLRPFLNRAAEVIEAGRGNFAYHMFGLADEGNRLPLFIPTVDDWMVIGEASLLQDHFDVEEVRTRLSSYSSHGRWDLVQTWIDVRPFDAFYTEHRWAPTSLDFVKVDVEGAEHLVLLGMEDFINTQRPAFMIENGDVALIDTILVAHDYSPYVYDVASECFAPRGDRGCLNSFYFTTEQAAQLPLSRQDFS